MENPMNNHHFPMVFLWFTRPTITQPLKQRARRARAPNWNYKDRIVPASFSRRVCDGKSPKKVTECYPQKTRGWTDKTHFTKQWWFLGWSDDPPSFFLNKSHWIFTTMLIYHSLIVKSPFFLIVKSPILMVKSRFFQLLNHHCQSLNHHFWCLNHHILMANHPSAMSPTTLRTKTQGHPGRRLGPHGLPWCSHFAKKTSPGLV